MNKKEFQEFVNKNSKEIENIRCQVSEVNLVEGERIFLDIFFTMNNSDKLVSIYESELYEDNEENLGVLKIIAETWKTKIQDWLVDIKIGDYILK